MDPLLDVAALRRAGFDRPDRLRGEGGLRAVRRGLYLGAAEFDGLTASERYRLRVLAAARTLAAGTVFSHESAAVLLGLPVLHRWPDVVHVIDERRGGGRSQLDVVRHCIGLELVQPFALEGALVTSPARTVLDLSMSRSFDAGVVTADAAFAASPGCREELERLVAAQRGRRGHRKAERVLAFADGAAGSPGESLSRVLIDRLGFRRPVLQLPVRTGGRTEYLDFAWPDRQTGGEFDGEVKYRQDRYRLGGSVEDVVIREKNRENRIRRLVPHLARWDWSDLEEPQRLERILLAAGVPRDHAPVRAVPPSTRGG